MIFEVSSVLKEVVCPYCGQSSSKVHSRYQREIQDLPMQNKKVVLLVRTRKMFCVNNLCNKKTFAEKHPFVAVNGKILSGKVRDWKGENSTPPKSLSPVDYAPVFGGLKTGELIFDAFFANIKY